MLVYAYESIHLDGSAYRKKNAATSKSIVFILGICGRLIGSIELVASTLSPDASMNIHCTSVPTRKNKMLMKQIVQCGRGAK